MLKTIWSVPARAGRGGSRALPARSEEIIRKNRNRSGKNSSTSSNFGNQNNNRQNDNENNNLEFSTQATSSNNTTVTVSNSNDETSTFTTTFLAITFSWLIVALWQRVIDNFAFGTLGMNENSTFHALIVAAAVTTLFILSVWIIDEYGLVPGGIERDVASEPAPNTPSVPVGPMSAGVSGRSVGVGGRSNINNNRSNISNIKSRRYSYDSE